MPAGAPIDFTMFGRAIAEFEFTLVFANAPIDRYARGEQDAHDDVAKARRAALLRQGQVRPVPRRGGTIERDVQRLPDARHRRAADRPGLWRGQGQRDLRRTGRRTRTSVWSRSPGNRADRYKFRTSPLRNVALAAGLLPQRRIHAARGRHPASPGCHGARCATTIRSPPDWTTT